MFKSFMIAAAALIVASPASAQSPLTEKNLSMALAKIIAEAALEQCQKDGIRVAVAVVDRGGHLKAFLRNDGPGRARG